MSARLRSHSGRKRRVLGKVLYAAKRRTPVSVNSDEHARSTQAYELAAMPTSAMSACGAEPCVARPSSSFASCMLVAAAPSTKLQRAQIDAVVEARARTLGAACCLALAPCLAVLK